MSCTKIIDGQFCGSTNLVEINNGFQVCRNCRIEMSNVQLRRINQGVLEANTPATIYAVLTPNNTIKIGRTENLYKRLQTLHHRLFGGRMTLLANFQGKNLDEAVLHLRFEQYRIRDVLGEQFLDVPEIRCWAMEVGIDEFGLEAARKYSMYTPVREPKQDPDYVLS